MVMNNIDNEVIYKRHLNKLGDNDMAAVIKEKR